MKYLINAELELIKPDYLGNAMRDGRFLNYQKVPAPKLKDQILFLSGETLGKASNFRGFLQSPWRFLNRHPMPPCSPSFRIAQIFPSKSFGSVCF